MRNALVKAIIEELWPVLGGNHLDGDTWVEIAQAVRAGVETTQSAALSAKDAEIAALREALQEIAKQKFMNEMGHSERDNADFEGAYEACIARARAALATDTGSGKDKEGG